VQQDVIVALRKRLYDAMARSPWELLAATRASTFTHALTDEVDRAGHAAYYGLDLAAGVAISLAYLAIAVRISPGMGGVVLACGAVLVLASRGSMRSGRHAGEAFSAATSRVFNLVGEHLGGMKAARAFGSEHRHRDAFLGAADDVDRIGR